ncbi:uncharacterized protein DS421_13g409950 [Arachis hypogaea]|nr:uncharacterized protein DS421_13g409950 [Arachis hypogaea]
MERGGSWDADCRTKRREGRRRRASLPPRRRVTPGRVRERGTDKSGRGLRRHDRPGRTPGKEKLLRCPEPHPTRRRLRGACVAAVAPRRGTRVVGVHPTAGAETREGENGSEAELRSNHRAGVLPCRRRTRCDLQPRRCQSSLLRCREAQLLLGTLSLLMGCAGKPLPPENVTTAASLDHGYRDRKSSLLPLEVVAAEPIRKPPLFRFSRSSFGSVSISI